MQNIRFRQFLLLCVKKAWHSTWEKADSCTTAAGIAIGVIVHYFPKWEVAVNQLYWEIPIAALASLSGYRLVMSPFWIYRDKDAELRELRKRLESSTVLAEEDPKVYLVPKNSEFSKSGIIPFDMFNLGQRVNVAHRIKVLPIKRLPSVSFGYVNHLEMNQHLEMLPVVEGVSRDQMHDIVDVLTRAWQEYALAEGEMDQSTDLTKFPFTIQVRYEEVSGTRKFESTIELVYSNKEHVMARLVREKYPEREHKIIEIVGMTVRRLS